MSGHRWSGWPGAWCLDCGLPDPVELGLAGNMIDENFPEDCREPGSKRNDPYARSA
jgi:hypothetical protein